MTQAKGVLPRDEDREVLYKNPKTCGYFVAVKLDPAMDRSRAEAWLGAVSQLVDQLVKRDDEGQKVAAVAVGLGHDFFVRPDGQPRFEVEPPAGFAPGVPAPNAGPALSGVPVVDGDVLFYVASVFEARVNSFISGLAAMQPDVQRVSFDRGYQRLDGKEPFGYLDGVRNVVPATARPRVVFVHRDEREADEPPWAEDGTYMAYLKILQRPDRFAALESDDARDQVIGRNQSGRRLDRQGETEALGREPSEPAPSLPPTSHVMKAGPRGHRDEIQIFRRGLPFIESSPDGVPRVGLNFCSFQASLTQFDVVFNDWLMSKNFPPQNGGDGGLDALLDPAREFTQIEKAGFFFVPPYHAEGLRAAIFGQPARRPPTHGQLVVHKRVVDPNDPGRSFERRGFRFQILDAQGQPVAGAEFETDLTGRGICPVELEIGASYTAQELEPLPISNVTATSTPFVMEHPNQQLHIVNQVTQPNTPYGG